MPIDFPDLGRLKNYFDHKMMVPYKEGEIETDYRERCAQFSEANGDIVEAIEVRSGKGWDKWGDKEKDGLLGR